MAEAEAGMVMAQVYQAAHDKRLLKCDGCGEMKSADEYPHLDRICHDRNQCTQCIETFEHAMAVSKAINKASDDVTAAIQAYIRVLASNVDLSNPHHERLLRRAVNFYQKAKLVFARDTDEGRAKARVPATLTLPSYANAQGFSAIVDTQANMEMWGNESDPELDGIPREQGVNGQETFGTRMVREIMAGIIPLLQRQVAAQEETNKLRAKELVANTPPGADGAIPRKGGGAEGSAVPVPPAPDVLQPPEEVPSGAQE